jgi:REP element-mobilizing transposase RayT
MVDRRGCNEAVDAECPLIHERAAGYPHDSSVGKAARAGSSENLEQLLPSGVWMRSTPNPSPRSWPITVSGAPSTGRRFWWASWQRSLSRKSVGSAKQGDFPIGAVNIQPDHVHLLLSASPSVAPAEIAHQVKGTTARKIFQSFPQVKKSLWGGAFWSRSYYVGSVGDRSGDTVLNYIELGQE